MDLELTLKWVGALVTLGITIPLGIKIAPSIKKNFSKAKKGNALTQDILITAKSEASLIAAVGGRDAFAVQEMHIHQGEDISGKRREALRSLKKANDGIVWAIGQSKNPRIRNIPDPYLTKLQDVFEANFSKLKKTDLELLEPIIGKIIDYQKKFAELEAPCAELNTAIDSLK